MNKVLQFTSGRVLLEGPGQFFLGLEISSLKVGKLFCNLARGGPKKHRTICMQGTLHQLAKNEAPCVRAERALLPTRPASLSKSIGQCWIHVSPSRSIWR